MVDISEYKVGVVLSIEENKQKKGGKALRGCTINIGDEDNPILVVTSASNVREGSRIVVALAGSTVLNEEGEEMELSKTSVGGMMSCGMLCDSRMLGWTGGAAGIAVQVPESFPLGSAPPSSKPRPNSGSGDDQSSSTPAVEVQGLFEKKLTKEEKKKLAAERRAAKKAAKEAKAKADK